MNDRIKNTLISHDIENSLDIMDFDRLPFVHCIVFFYYFKNLVDSAKIELSYSSNLNIFQDCLIIWNHFSLTTIKQDSNTFQTLHTSVFSKTPFVLNYKRRHNRLIQLKRKYTSHISKYCNCYLMFHEISLGRNTFSNFKAEDDPDFVIYFSNNNDDSVLKFISENLVAANYSGIQLYLNKEGNLHPIVHRSSNSKSFINLSTPLPPFSKITQIKNYLANLQKHFNGLVVSTQDSGGIDMTTCEDKSFPAEVSQKILCALSSHLNITFSLNKFVQVNGMDILFGIVLTDNIALLLKHGRSVSIKYEFPTTTLTRNAFVYVVVANRDILQKSNLTAMTQPFQMGVWVVIFFALFLMPLALMVTMSKNLPLNLSLKTYLGWAFLAFASIVDQCNDEVRHLFKSSWQSAFLWTMWNYFSMIIMNCYDGQLYSFLSSEFDYRSPLSLKELAHSNLPILTISTTVQYVNRTHTIEPRVHSFLKPTKINGGGNMKVPRYYDLLANKIKFISMASSTFEIIAQQTVNFTRVQKHNSIAILDTEEQLKTLHVILNLAENFKTVKRTPINNWYTCKGWLIRKYFAFNRIQQVLWQVVEGGFDEFWKSNYFLATQLDMAQNLHKSQTFIRNKIELGKVFGNIVESGNGIEGGNQVNYPRPMTLNMISEVMKTAGLIYSTTVIIMLTENVHFFIIYALSERKMNKCRQIIRVHN